MKVTWGRFYRRVATVCMVGVASAWSSAVAYALAMDCSINAPYSDGWQAGDNGGFGFGPWNFDGTYNTPIGQTMDSLSPPNDLGLAWTLYNADAPPGPGIGTDISQAGRAILGGLLPGRTLSVVIDNPTEERFFRGYTVRLNTGGANMGYAGDNSTTPVFDPGSISSRLAVGTFEYFNSSPWFSSGTGGNPGLDNSDTNAGVRIDVTLTGVDTYALTMTPLDNPALASTTSGTLAGPAGSVIDWVEFELYNTDSDYYPTNAGTNGETDFYISCIEIVPEPSSAALMLLGGGAAAGMVRARKRK